MVKQVEEIGPKKGDAIDRPKCRGAVNFLEDNEVNSATLINSDQTKLKTFDLCLSLSLLSMYQILKQTLKSTTLFQESKQ